MWMLGAIPFVWLIHRHVRFLNSTIDVRNQDTFYVIPMHLFAWAFIGILILSAVLYHLSRKRKRSPYLTFFHVFITISYSLGCGYFLFQRSFGRIYYSGLPAGEPDPIFKTFLTLELIFLSLFMLGQVLLVINLIRANSSKRSFRARLQEIK